MRSRVDGVTQADAQWLDDLSRPLSGCYSGFDFLRTVWFVLLT